MLIPRLTDRLLPTTHRRFT